MLQSLFLYFGSYTCITEHILVLRILYLFYKAYSCISNLILVLQSIYLSYGSYTCVTELILVFRILYLYYETYSALFLCEGTRRYYKLKQIKIISNTYKVISDICRYGH